MRGYNILILLLTIRYAESRLEQKSDIYLTTPQLIVKYGYPVEIHQVPTKDGYNLTLHRIPYGHNNDTHPRQPVMIQHGILCSSADWVLLGPGNAIAYVLADAGYDVWLGNARGNTYSRTHQKYPTQDKRFWDFSFHEMGLFDLPAVIDYILMKTGYKTLKYIGHSMGATMFFVLMSEHPEYNHKIEVMIGMAPVAYISHAPTPLRDFSITNGTAGLMRTLRTNGVYDFLSHTSPVLQIGREMCQQRLIALAVCENILFLFGGYDSTQLTTSMVPVIVGHIAGTSSKTILHYAQLMKNGRFSKFDYGNLKNKALYGTAKTPSYNLDQVKVPTWLLYSDLDALAPRTDVLILYKKLPNVIGIYRVPFHQFNHLDFMWGKDAKLLVYDTVLNILSKY